MATKIYFTRHAKNRFRKFKFDKESVRSCIENPWKREYLKNRINLWCPFDEKYIRVTIVEEDRIVVITVTIKTKLKEGLQ